MKVVLVEPGKIPREAEIADALKSMQDAVGGFIQAIYPFEDLVALICNEEAKLEGLPLNRALYSEENHKCYDVVAGTFFLCGAPDNSEQFESLSAAQVAKYMEYFRIPEVFLNIGGSLCIVPMVTHHD
jgi:hypothetical protein